MVMRNHPQVVLLIITVVVKYELSVAYGGQLAICNFPILCPKVHSIQLQRVGRVIFSLRTRAAHRYLARVEPIRE